jgi:sugar O-acyltransferase (sialic acid O-acetyltransferase NeuD family)
MRDLVIVGAGGFGREVWEWSNAAGFVVRGFVDDNPKTDFTRLPAPYLGNVAEYRHQEGEGFVCGIGKPATRRGVVGRMQQRGGSLVTIIHPTAIVAHTATIEAGCVICPFALISANAYVGVGSVVYYHSSVDHDARIGPWAQISGHCDIMGGAQLGEAVFLGSHAAILPGIRVGDDAVVGAGAVVTKDVPVGAVVCGVPAYPKFEF